MILNPKVDSPLSAATVAAAVPLHYYQLDPVHQSLGLRSWMFWCTQVLLKQNFAVVYGHICILQSLRNGVGGSLTVNI